MPHSVVIVGASAAGVSVAGGLRARGFTGEITILGDEEGTPYDRPPLTKQILAGTWLPERAQLLPEARLQALEATFVLGRRAVELDMANRRVITDGGAEHPYDALVIATGVEPRTLPGSPETDRVRVLRTLDDALTLKGMLVPDAELVVVGAGFLGLEAACSARQLGAYVTVVEPLAAPLADRIGARAAGRLLDLHAKHGVQILTGAFVKSFLPTAGGAVGGVQLADDRVLEADVVLVAIGCVPRTDWLDGSGLLIEDGVVCDEYCAAAPGIWAAGDVARWFHPRLGRHLRVEHRMNASEQGEAVARNILGERVPFEPVPFFWTDHYDVKVQVAGIIPHAADPVLVEEDAATGSFVEAFYEEDVLAGVVGWNAARAMMPYRRTLGEPQPTAP